MLKKVFHNHINDSTFTVWEFRVTVRKFGEVCRSLGLTDEEGFLFAGTVFSRACLASSASIGGIKSFKAGKVIQKNQIDATITIY